MRRFLWMLLKNGQREYFAVVSVGESRADAVPCLAVPSSDVVHRQTACGREFACDIQLGPVARIKDFHGIAVAAQSRTHGTPGLAVPFGDGGRGDAAGLKECSADKKLR